MRSSNIYLNEDEHVEDLPYDNVKLKCMYVEENDHFKQFKSKETLSFFSANIQSLPAKFSDLKELLVSLEVDFDVICLQELWRIHDEDLYRLPGYKFVFKSRSNKDMFNG